MALPKQPVLIDKDLHKRLKTRMKAGSNEMTKVVSRLVEMYLNGEVKVIIPQREI